MPELPDVRVFKKYLDATSLHQRIRNVDVADRDVLGEVGPRRLARRLRGRKLESSRPHGKWLFVETDGAGFLLLHFGMTGFLDYFGSEEPEKPHARVLFRFTNGSTLAYHSQRKLGKVDLVDEPEEFLARKKLGPDPLSREFDLSAFRKRIEGRRGSIKSVLMNQKVLAGMGNVYSDEALFQAGIAPDRPAEKLDRDEVASLYRSMRKVIETAIRAKVDVNELPRRYLLPNREQGARCPRCRGIIRRRTIGGRSAYFCDRHQA